tara:strand:+ start:4165 stop:5031 length:867 start_codon:yes stop_codon:yes gene_type:complete
MYYPLSQITTDLYTSQEEFLVQSTNLPYEGKYYSTSDGKFFTGATPQDGSNFRLIRNTENDSSKDVEVGVEGTFNKTNISLELTPPSYQNASTKPPRLAPPPTSKVVLPTPEECIIGEFTRYFLKKNNQNTYLEIDEATFTRYQNKNNETQHELYTPTSLPWDLTGNPIDVYNVNMNIVLLRETQLKWAGFSLWFKTRYVKYYKPTSQNFFNTKGGELKIETNNENYAGFYHVSPNLGKIMEGKFHKPTLHNILIPFKGDEIKGKVQVRVDNEVGTSRRTNYQRNSGY